MTATAAVTMPSQYVFDLNNSAITSPPPYYELNVKGIHGMEAKP
jgi:hypothetical protein